MSNNTIARTFIVILLYMNLFTIQVVVDEEEQEYSTYSADSSILIHASFYLFKVFMICNLFMYYVGGFKRCCGNDVS